MCARVASLPAITAREAGRGHAELPLHTHLQDLLCSLARMLAVHQSVKIALVQALLAEERQQVGRVGIGARGQLLQSLLCERKLRVSNAVPPTPARAWYAL